jgi:hypothetical protein
MIMVRHKNFMIIGSILFFCSAFPKSCEDKLFQAIKRRNVRNVEKSICAGAPVKNGTIKLALLCLLEAKRLPSYAHQRHIVLHILSILVDHGAQPTVRDYIMAASENMLELVKRWTYTQDGDFTFDKDQVKAAFIASITSGAYDVAKYLLNQGVNPNEHGKSYALELAVLSYYNLKNPVSLEFIQLLLKHGALMSDYIYQEVQGRRWKYPHLLRPGVTPEKIQALEHVLADYDHTTSAS